MGKKEDADPEEKEESWRAQLRAMNERFESRLDENVFSGVRDETIYHGLKLTTSTVLHKTFTDLCFCDDTKEYLLLEKKVALHRYSMQGKLLQPSINLNARLTFTRMIWCDGAKCLACYDPDGEQIWILTSSCVTLQAVKNEFMTKIVFYDSLANEIIVADSQQSIKYSLDNMEEDLESTKALTYMDPEFGPTWQLDHTALLLQSQSESAAAAAAAANQRVQLVASYMANLYLLPLEFAVEENNEETEQSSDRMMYSKRISNASAAPITAVHFIAINSWIVIGDQQGNVTAWNLNLECMMLYNNAHEGRIHWLASHPSICGFLSYSCDDEGISKLQVWSCNFRTKIEAFNDLGRILGLAVVESAVSVVVLTAAKLFYLIMHQAYCFFAPLTSQSKNLFSTQNPMYQTKTIVASDDNSVRIFSSYGKQLNVQILPKDTLLVGSAAYSGNRNQLFTIILKTGEILMSDTNVCPAKFQHVFVNDGPEITCMTVYEYFDEIRDENRRSKKPRIFYPIKIRIITGTREGKLVVLNESTGKQEAIRQAHNGAVKQLKSFVASQRIISLGIDRCIKVWRVFANLLNPLSLYYILSFAVPIANISLIGVTLCIVNSSKDSIIHRLLMENMQRRIRLEHSSSKDHTAPIVDMTTMESLEICATSSLDNTIRIWNQENCLLKILELNICARMATFSSVLGDIVFSAGRHLYKISYENYLSPKYRARIVAKELSKEIDEDSVTENIQYRAYDGIVDRNLMLRPVISTPLASLDTTSLDKPRPDVLIKKQICALYEYRDEDIRKIRDNLIEPRKRATNRALMTTDVWEKYIMDLLNNMTRSPPTMPEYDFKNIRERQLKEKKSYNERGVFFMRYGYNVDEVADDENLDDLVKNTKLPLHGFLPNSVLYKKKEKVIPKVEVLKEPKIKKEPVKYKYPSEFYPQEEKDTDKRESIRLSQIMTENMDIENAA